MHAVEKIKLKTSTCSSAAPLKLTFAECQHTSVDSAVQGQLAHAGGAAWFAVALDGHSGYAVSVDAELPGGGGIGDSVVEVYDHTDTLVGMNDVDPRGGCGSFLEWSACHHHISVSVVLADRDCLWRAAGSYTRGWILQDQGHGI